MKKVKATINGTAIVAEAGDTILEAAKKNGIDVPSLCYHEELPPIGACRLCVVEVEGEKTFVGSCYTPIREGMVINTHSPKVLEARRIILELLLSSHAGECLFCVKANRCELRKLAADLGVGVSRFSQRKRYYPIEDKSVWINRDMTKCILCYRCIRSCDKLAKKNLYSMGYRGFENKVICDLDNPLDKKACETCEQCVRLCPVGALVKPERRFKKKIEKPFIVT